MKTEGIKDMGWSKVSNQTEQLALFRIHLSVFRSITIASALVLFHGIVYLLAWFTILQFMLFSLPVSSRSSLVAAVPVTCNES